MTNRIDKYYDIVNTTVETANMVNDVLLESLNLFECQKWGMDTFYHWMVSTTCVNMISAWFWAIFAQIVFIVLVLILWYVISYRFDNFLTPMVYDNSNNYNQLGDKELNVNEIIYDKTREIHDVGSINSSNAQWQY